MKLLIWGMMNHAHVQPNGAYHYHGMPELLIDFLGSNKDF